MKVADSIVCSNYEIYCVRKEDQFLLTVQGGGEQFVINMRCDKFLEQNGISWDTYEKPIQNRNLNLQEHTAELKKFMDQFGEPHNKKIFQMDEIKFTNKYGVDET